MTTSNTVTLADIVVLGAGSYGTALAICLARNGHKTVLWGRDSEHVAQMTQSRSNERYLPGSPLPEGLILEEDLAIAVSSSQNVLVVVPSHAFGDMLLQMLPEILRQLLLAFPV